MQAPGAELVRRGRMALAAGDPRAARDLFEEAVTHAETGDALSGLAEATYLTGTLADASGLFARAFRAYRAEGRPVAAARVAWILAYQNFLHGDEALVGGWIERARELVSETDDCVEHHWVALFDALGDADPMARERRLRAVADVGDRLGDANLEYDARCLVGQVCIETGRVGEGMAILDQALTAVCAGEVSEFVVIEGAFCVMLGACEVTHDVRRAERWLQVGDELGRARGLPRLGALCRGYYGGVLTAAGRYAEAEDTLREAVDALAHGYALARDNARARLAEVRIRQGRFEEAAQLLRGLEEHPDAACPLAELHLAHGRYALARDRLERALPHVHGTAEGRLLALLVDVDLASGALEAAESDLRRLEEVAGSPGSGYLAAAGAFARGRVCLASGTPDSVAFLREAVSAFAQARLPFELARAKLELARALTTTSPQVAVAEATAALRQFEDLDAARMVDAAAALLRDLGTPVRVGPKGLGTLTRREEEVLSLLGHGLANPEIAERLVISRKTVEHHVGRILFKLGLRNRAEAAAFAATHPVAPGHAAH